jgi:hypothetical protein
MTKGPIKRELISTGYFILLLPIIMEEVGNRNWHGLTP